MEYIKDINEERTIEGFLIVRNDLKRKTTQPYYNSFGNTKELCQKNMIEKCCTDNFTDVHFNDLIEKNKFEMKKANKIITQTFEDNKYITSIIIEFVK